MRKSTLQKKTRSYTRHWKREWERICWLESKTTNNKNTPTNPKRLPLFNSAERSTRETLLSVFSYAFWGKRLAELSAGNYILGDGGAVP